MWLYHILQCCCLFTHRMNFTDNNDLFLGPKTNQYGSHMVMTDVNKPTKTKFINIDTKFRDEYNYNDASYFNVTLPDRYKYNITIPERVNNAKTVTIKSVELPMTFYNISTNLGNNTLTVLNTVTSVTTVVTIPDGNYTTASLITQLGTSLSSASVTGLTVALTSNKTVFTATGTNFKVSFSYQDKYSFKSSLGWLLGFRALTVTVTPSVSATSTYPLLLTSPFPRYLYLSLEEFNKGVQNSFVTPVANAFLNKNVIARITMNPSVYGYGSVLNATLENGLLLSDTRSYNGKVDLQKLNVQLFNDTGMPVDLNGQDFSFCIEATYE